jgi:hypothetical protein
MADPELTNWKCGIDVVWGVGDGSDKGTAYYEEYPYFDKRIYDVKTVYIRDNTLITMSHNERNIASIVLNSRNKTVIGTGIGFSGFGGTSTADVGTQGANWTGGGGIIRLKFDKMLSRNVWSTGNSAPTFPHYTGAFTLRSAEYVTGVPVVGVTGGTTGWSNSADMSNQSPTTGFYWRGAIDRFGDEWHVFTYADDDITIGGANRDSTASDGKSAYLVVNPKTPCLTVRASGSGQFYTTPPCVYLMPIIHQPQTTYYTGGVGNEVTFELRDIYENPVAYRINSGDWATGGASVQLNWNDFNVGQNTLDYYYSGNESFVKLRNIVRDPDFPSAAEQHGNILWGDAAGLAKVTGRLTQWPYSVSYAALAGESKNGQNGWNALRYSGFRLGGFTSPNNWGYWQAPSPHINAFMALTTNFTGYRAGIANNKTYASYAKEMIIENVCNIVPVGFELNQASQGIPAQEYNYRGYWDAQWAFYQTLGYDILIDGYKNTQFTGGITPIEDYFIRDQMASWNHLCGLWIGGYYGGGTPQSPGMWGTSRNVVATANTLVMPTYSTPYYGTAGMDGNTGVFPWAPYATGNFTWKRLFVDSDYPTGNYPYMPVYPYGMQGVSGMVNDLCMITVSGLWIDRTAYLSYSQFGQWLYLYSNLQKQYYQSVDRQPIDRFLWFVSNGNATGLKNSPSLGDPYLFRAMSTVLMNTGYADYVTNGMAWTRSLANNNGNSLIGGLDESTVVGLTYLDSTADTTIGTQKAEITPRISPSYGCNTMISRVL